MVQPKAECIVEHLGNILRFHFASYDIETQVRGLVASYGTYYPDDRTLFVSPLYDSDEIGLELQAVPGVVVEWTRYPWQSLPTPPGAADGDE